MNSGSVGARLPWELEWVQLHSFLRQSGYEMRARYQPDWAPSWLKITRPSFLIYEYEDGLRPMRCTVLDAVRTHDNTPVFMKMIDPDDDSVEHAQFFSEPPRDNDPCNHCAPLLDVLRPPERPDRTIIMMPRYVPWNVWPFSRVGEAVDFFSQIFEGLCFMHDHDFAHLDIGTRNLMMDGLHLYKEACHPLQPERVLNGHRKASHYERHQSPRPVKYYFIDFDQSTHFESFETRQLVRRARRADKSVPEELAHRDRPCDPFALDVYCLGNILRVHWLGAYRNTAFIRPLVDDMVQTDPSLRPTARQIVERFEVIRASLSPKDLARKLRRNREYFLDMPLMPHAFPDMKPARITQLPATERRTYGFARRVFQLLTGRSTSTGSSSVVESNDEGAGLAVGGRDT